MKEHTSYRLLSPLSNHQYFYSTAIVNSLRANKPTMNSGTPPQNGGMDASSTRWQDALAGNLQRPKTKPIRMLTFKLLLATCQRCQTNAPVFQIVSDRRGTIPRPRIPCTRHGKHACPLLHISISDASHTASSPSPLNKPTIRQFCITAQKTNTDARRTDCMVCRCHRCRSIPSGSILV